MEVGHCVEHKLFPGSGIESERLWLTSSKDARLTLISTSTSSMDSKVLFKTKTSVSDIYILVFYHLKNILVKISMEVHNKYASEWGFCVTCSSKMWPFWYWDSVKNTMWIVVHFKIRKTEIGIPSIYWQYKSTCIFFLFTFAPTSDPNVYIHMFRVF